MINTSKAWHLALDGDQRNYLEQVRITLQDQTVLNLTNADIWMGGFAIDDAVSSDNDFQIGAAIVNKFSLTLNNIYEDFSEHDFTNAEVYVKVGLQLGNTPEDIEKGLYTVNTATYNGDLIRLECLDYMAKFDRPYSESGLTYPQTLDAIVRDACTCCGITLGTLNFPHKNTVIQTRPDGEDITFREVIAWCAQIAGCYARVYVENSVAKLGLKWYDRAALESVLDGGIFDQVSASSYTTGAIADGGVFNPWTAGDGYVYDGGLLSEAKKIHFISSLYSKDISVDDVIITGVRILVKTDDSANPISIHQTGSSGYVVSIENNPLITEDMFSDDPNTDDVLKWLGRQLIGFTFRKASVTHGSDPSIEAGDVAIVYDGKGLAYPIIVSRTNFSVGSAQQTISAAQTPARNSSAKYSVETRNYLETNKLVEIEKTEREIAEEAIRRELENGAGLYVTTKIDISTNPQSTIYYLHDKQDLEDSDVQIRFSTAGIAVTADGTATPTHWYGLTARGDMITNLLSSTGIYANWIRSGTLVIGGTAIDAPMLQIQNSSGQAIFTGDRTGITMNRGVIQSANGTVVIDLNNNTITFPDGSINSNMLSIGDYNNYATVNPNFDGTMCKITGRETEIITDVNTTGNPVVFHKKLSTQNTCALSTTYVTNDFKVGDEIYYEVTARALSGNGGDAAIVIACYDSSKTLLTTKTSAITLTASYQTFTGTLEITNSNFNSAAYVWFYIRDDRTTKSQILVRSAKILKKFGGNVVIDGSLTAGKIHGGTLKLGGASNGNGLLEVYNGSNVLKGKWTKDGSVYYGTYTDRYSISADQITKIAASGLINASGSKGAFLGGGYLEFGNIGSSWNADTLSPDSVLSTSGRYAILSGDRLLFNYNGYVFLDSPTLELYPSSNTVGILSGVGDLSIRASQGDSDAYTLGFYINTTRKARINKDGMDIYGDMSATGTKSRVVDTEQYSDRLLYCYETASPMFGDVGEGVIGSDGQCYVSIDPIFAKTVNLNQYQVFLQKYGQGECYVSERHPSYFIVSGTEGLSFGWEIKAKQSDYDQLRLERNDEPVSISNEINYASEAINHINEIREGRISA